MKTIIYYFSGTGNSLVLAKNLSWELGESQVSCLAKLKSQEEIIPDADRIGIVYPVYAMGPPLIVIDFIKKLKLSKSQYLFVVANYGGVQGAGITKIKRLLKACNLNLQAAFGLIMPGNYTPLYEAWPQDKQKAVFEKARNKIKKVAAIIKQGKSCRPELGFFLIRWLLWEPICALSLPRMSGQDKNFWITQKCDGCAVCSRVCPVANIEIVNQKPVWQRRCQQCFACFHWCPQEAIQYGKRTIKRKRYRHPDVQLKDFF